MKKILFIVFISHAILFSRTIIKGDVSQSGTNSPIQGANIQIKGTETGTATTASGSFVIETEIEFPIELLISHIGFESKIYIVLDDRAIKIKMDDRILAVDAIDVSGVRQKYEADVSTSVITLDKSFIDELGIRDLGSALTRISGVSTKLSSSGKQTISIRGSNAEDVPVYLDGIPINDVMTGVADLSSIDLNSIENIQVIKSGNSMLYGEGAIGGVVDMTSVFPEKKSLKLKIGSGIPSGNDFDYSGNGGYKKNNYGGFGSLALKSRSYGFRTVTYNEFGHLTLGYIKGNQSIRLNYHQMEKSLEFPGGSLTNADLMKLYGLKFSGNIFGSPGWTISLGRRFWNLSQDYFSSLNEEVQDLMDFSQIMKRGRIGIVDLTGFLEYQEKGFSGKKTYFDFNSQPVVIQNTDLSRNSLTGAGVAQVIVFGDTPALKVAKFEMGIRASRLQTNRTQSFEFKNLTSDGTVIQYIKPDFLLNNFPTNKRLGIRIEGLMPLFNYIFFINQGNNTRLPTLSDYFRFSNALHQGDNDSTLTKESLSTTDFGLILDLDTFDNNSLINSIKVEFNYFQNLYSNKIAYRFIENSPPAPFNTETADVSGFETFIVMGLIKDKVEISVSGLELEISDFTAFPNKPERKWVTAVRAKNDKMSASLDMIFEGKKVFLLPGLGFGSQEKRMDGNFSISYRNTFFNWNMRLTYSIQNFLSKSNQNLSAKESLDKGLNYFDQYREMVSLSVEL